MKQTISTSSLMQKYDFFLTKEIINQRIPSSEKYLERICHYSISNCENIREICMTFYYYDYLTKRNLLYMNLYNITYLELKAKVMEKMNQTSHLPNQFYLSKDDMLEIGEIKTWDNVQSLNQLVDNDWLFCQSKEMWDDYSSRCDGIYIIRNFNYGRYSNKREIAILTTHDGTMFLGRNGKDIEVESIYISNMRDCISFLVEKRGIRL